MPPKAKPARKAASAKARASAKPQAKKATATKSAKKSAKAASAKKSAKAASAKKAAKAPKSMAAEKPSSILIDQRIRDLADWRGETLARMRALVLEADKEIVEEVKWIKPSNPWGVAVWSRDGIVCTGEVYKDNVKLTFANGASVPDPARLFNASLEGHTRRAIDIREGEKVDANAFQQLVQAAVAVNAGRAKRR